MFAILDIGGSLRTNFVQLNEACRWCEIVEPVFVKRNCHTSRNFSNTFRVRVN